MKYHNGGCDYCGEYSDKIKEKRIQYFTGSIPEYVIKFIKVFLCPKCVV